MPLTGLRVQEASRVEMKKVIVITGTPGSGKTTVSRKVAELLGSCELISANDIVRDMRLFSGYSRDGEMIADMRRLKAEIKRRVRSSRADVVIIEGHLLCDMKIGGATAVVIREHLNKLLLRMRKRRYSRKKIEGNIVAEAIDYCGVNALANYTEVYELESGRDTAAKVLGIINGKRVSAGRIEMLGELNDMLKKLGKAAI